MDINWGQLLSAGVQAGGAYLGYRNQEKKQKELESQYKAYNAAKTAQAALAAQQGGGSRSGGGGGGGRNTSKMQSIISQGYADYNKMLQPYIDESNKALPAMSALYGKGIEGMSGFSDQVFNPEFMKKALTLDGPPEMNLPEYLMGAKKNA
jgi:hypothetical protein